MINEQRRRRRRRRRCRSLAARILNAIAAAASSLQRARGLIGRFTPLRAGGRSRLAAACRAARCFVPSDARRRQIDDHQNLAVCARVA